MTAAPLLQLENAVVKYRAHGRADGVTALAGVSLDLMRGRIVGLAGPNGAGKTTLLEVCIAALPLDSGHVRWFGEPTPARQRIGFAPDVTDLPSRLTVRESLVLFALLDGIPRPSANAAIAELAERLKVTDALDRRVETLSRGTAQRVGIIQAVIGEREIIICDESFAPLDPVAQVDVRELLVAEARRGAAVLVSSHQLDQLPKFADEVLILASGRVVRRLDAEELRAAAADGDSQMEQVFLSAIAPPGTPTGGA